MNQSLTFVAKLFICLSFICFILLGRGSDPAIAQGAGPVQPVSPAQLGQVAAFVGVGNDEATIQSLASSQLLGNPGFENGTWSPWEPFGAPVLDTANKHSGSQSAHLGNANDANDQIIQTVAVPTTVSDVTLDFWYRLNTDETITAADFFCYGLWSQDGATALMQHCLDLGSAGNQGWSRETYPLTANERADVAGRSVLLAFIVLTDKFQPSRVWVDDTALNITTSSTPPPAIQSKIYLPLITKAPPVSAPPPPTPPPDSGQTGAFWLPYINGGSMVPTYGTSVAVDSAGGIHVGFALYSGLDNGRKPAYYAYCATNCATLAGWRLTRLSDSVREVRLALDPTGHPRMLLHISLSGDTHQYQYAACDTGCTNSSNWTITGLLLTNENTGGRSKQNNRYFTLDPQGRPAFVYPDYDANHYGTFYAHCSFNCTNAGNWSEVMVVQGQWLGKPALTFTPSGQPRLTATYYVPDDPQYNVAMWRLLYIGCDNACDNPAQWQSVSVAPTIGDGDFSVRVDTNGRPRIAVFPTQADLSLMQPGQLYYLWCNSPVCLTNPDDWNKVSVGTPLNYGFGVDMVLDSTNRPRLAYQMGDEGLGYAWCNTNCEATASWQARTAEATATIMAQYPPELPQHQGCPYLTWLNGVRPSLALDSTGQPRVSYDAELWWGGSNPNIVCDIGVPVTRVALFNQP